jgi:hypothetical protein
MGNPHEARDKLIHAALTFVTTRMWQDMKLPGPTDDAEDEYNEERLAEAAKEYVEGLNA